MFLNDLGQAFSFENPQILQWKTSSVAVLLTESAAIKYTKLPRDWRGIIYTSERIFDEIRRDYSLNLETVATCVLAENVTNNITIGCGREWQLTMISVSSETAHAKVMFLLRDNFTTNLYTDGQFLKDFHIFVKNAVLRSALKSGIDVLYIQDSACKVLSDGKLHPSETELRALLLMVRPKKVHGIYGMLPQHFQNLYLPTVDIYSKPTATN